MKYILETIKIIKNRIHEIRLQRAKEEIDIILFYYDIEDLSSKDLRKLKRYYYDDTLADYIRSKVDVTCEEFTNVREFKLLSFLKQH